MEQTNQTGPGRAKRACFAVVQHLPAPRTLTFQLAECDELIALLEDEKLFFQKSVNTDK